MPAIPKAQAPALVQFYNWIFHPLAFMETHYRQMGDRFLARGTLMDWIFLSHPDDLKYMLTHDGQELSAPGEYNKILTNLLGHNSGSPSHVRDDDCAGNAVAGVRSVSGQRSPRRAPAPGHHPQHEGRGRYGLPGAAGATQTGRSLGLQGEPER